MNEKDPAMNDGYIPREQLEGWKRFEMGSIGAASPAAKAPAPAAPAPSADFARAATQEGFRKGYAAGEARAAAEAARLATLARDFGAAIEGLERELADRVLDLALDIAKQMLRSDVNARREALLPVVREAMRCLPENTQRMQLQLNPADVELVRGRIGDELNLGGWIIVEDHRIEPGGCRIAAPSGDIDATLPTRWRKIIATLGRETPWNES
jgi:flagellar assembly protein FliH